MRHVSLFSGIGGFDLAAQWMGWENIFHCEWNPFGQRILKHYWPNAISYSDITKTDFTVHRGTIDVLTGGFPCQPYSTAGKRLGKEDERHLWPEMLRAIREIKPRWVVGENVRGLISWNGGLVFDEVQTDLEAAGYEVQPFLLPAAGVNAPHQRYRIWFVAHCNSDGQFRGDCKNEVSTSERGVYAFSNTFQGITDGIASNACGQGLPQPTFGKLSGVSGTPERKQRCKLSRTFATPTSWQDFPTQSPVCSGDDGIPSNAHFRTFRNENAMDRNLVIKSALDAGRLHVDFETGKIYSTRQRGKEGQMLELPGADCNGYIVHNIMFDGIKKQCRAHQIVWIAANGLYDKDALMIDHINRDRKDNRLCNLRLVDSQGNRDNATPYEGKLSQEQKDMVWFMNKESHMSMREIAEIVGISKSRVQQIVAEHEGLDGITFSKWRNESIKGAGNAIVPQVALQIFKAIEQYESL